MAFADQLGIEAERVEDGVARIVFEADERHLNEHGTVHGGAVATLVDVAWDGRSSQPMNMLGR